MNLSEKEYQLLRELQRNEKHKKNYVKVTVLLMLHGGYTHELISFSLGISAQTVANYISHYNSVGLDKYLESHYMGYSGRLSDEQKAILKVELDSKLYCTSKEIAEFISAKFGIKYTCTGLVHLLHKLGYSYKKTKLVPCEANIEAQIKFLDKLNEMSGKAQKDGDVVVFADGVHPQHNTKSSYAWIAKGKEKEVLSVSGRSRLNINAVMNADDPCDVVMVESESVNAQSTIALYKKLEAKYPDAANIYVICDNARYYKNKTLNEFLENSRVRQVFLPPYSPNLNLIERLWKFMRKKVINCSFYRDFGDFKDAIHSFFENIQQYKAELESLISWNFHVPNPKTN